MIIFYYFALVLLVLVAYAGWQETLKLIFYLDLLLKYQIVKVQMWSMRKKLERELNIPPN